MLYLKQKKLDKTFELKLFEHLFFIIVRIKGLTRRKAHMDENIIQQNAKKISKLVHL